MHHKPSVTAKTIHLAALAACVSGCGAYLHRPALETATAKIQTDVKALPVPAYLAEQQKRLAEFAVEEDRALAGYLTASRDFSLLNVIQPSAGSSDRRTPAEKLRAKVDEELMRLAGQAELSERVSRRLQTAQEIAATRSLMTPFLARQVQGQAQDYRSRGGKAPTDCAKVLANPEAPAAETAEAKSSYQILGTICGQIRRDNAWESDCALGVGGELKTACERLARRNASQLQDRAKKLDEALKALRALAAAEEDPVATAKIRTLIADAEAAAGSAAELSTNEKYAKVIEALNKVFSIKLGKALETIASVPKSKTATSAKTELLAALGLIDAIDKVAAPNGDPMDEPSALLIGIAKTQHDLNIVNIDLAEEKAMLALAGQEANAIRTSLHFFARARDILCPAGPRCVPGRRGNLGQPAIAEALGYYLNGFNQGVIPFEILRFREIQVSRSSAIARAQAAEADYRALIQPAIDQIAAYGQGGIKPEHLAPLLGSLPVPTF